MMIDIDIERVQAEISSFYNKLCYIHFEMTSGAYAAYRQGHSASGYIRNARVHLLEGKITGEGPFRVGLKTEDGWIYADGLTKKDEDGKGTLLLYGFDSEGKMQIALQLSDTPFQ